ncbi:MAG: hypothetical protein AAGK01_11765 [Pseudomonadota bacterium]
MKLTFPLLTAALAAFFAFQGSPGFAQSDEAERVPKADCELHVWGTLNISAIDRDDSYSHVPLGTLTQTYWRELPLEERMRKTLSLPMQREILEESQLLSHPVLEGRKLTWHTTPSFAGDFTNKEAMNNWKRASASTSECYSELHYAYVTFLDQPGKDVLQSGWILRHFGDQDQPIEWAWDGGYEKTEREFWTGEASREAVQTEVTANVRENFRKFLTRRKIKRVLRAMNADAQ